MFSSRRFFPDGMNTPARFADLFYPIAARSSVCP